MKITWEENKLFYGENIIELKPTSFSPFQLYLQNDNIINAQYVDNNKNIEVETFFSLYKIFNVLDKNKCYVDLIKRK